MYGSMRKEQIKLTQIHKTNVQEVLRKLDEIYGTTKEGFYHKPALKPSREKYPHSRLFRYIPGSCIRNRKNAACCQGWIFP